MTLPAMVQYVVNSFHNTYAFNYRVDGVWKHLSTEVFLESIRRLALGFTSLGLKKGETVGLLAKSSPQWLVVDLAVMVAGGVSVPLFSHISEDNFKYEVSDSKMKFLVVIGGDQWTAVSHHQKLFQRVILCEADKTGEGENVIGFNEVMTMGDGLSRLKPGLYSEMRDSVTDDDLATIIYTSGSTGIPKGVELTHRNLISQVHAAGQRFPLDATSDRILTLLPLAHVFQRMLMYYYVSTGVSVYFADDLKKVGQLCLEVRPTIAAMVPLLVEKIYARIEAKVNEASFLKRMLGKWAIKLAHEVPNSLWQRIQFNIADKLVYTKFRDGLGGAFRAVIVGGAPLNRDLCRFFINIGIPMYQGYGLTETSPVLCTNYPDHNKPGTVGQPFPGVEVMLTEEKEIIARGPNVMRGYHGDPSATRAIIKNGWIHTGDMGSIDEHGFVSVTGRIKEIMKTAGGKMVAPVPIEQAICESPLIDMAMLIADDKKYVSCLLFPNVEEVNRLKVKAGDGSNESLEDFLYGDYMKRAMDSIVEKVNSRINEWEQIRRYHFVLEPLTVEGGDLTPTLKIRRKIVEKKHAQEIESMYK